MEGLEFWLIKPRRTNRRIPQKIGQTTDEKKSAQDH
jgi:hypothetical protein